MTADNAIELVEQCSTRLDNAEIALRLPCAAGTDTLAESLDGAMADLVGAEQALRALGQHSRAALPPLERAALEEACARARERLIRVSALVGQAARFWTACAGAGRPGEEYTPAGDVRQVALAPSRLDHRG